MNLTQAINKLLDTGCQVADNAHQLPDGNWACRDDDMLRFRCVLTACRRTLPAILRMVEDCAVELDKDSDALRAVDALRRELLKRSRELQASGEADEDQV